MWPRAGHATLGQHVVVGSMLLLRDAWGNLPGGVWLAPRLHDKCTSPWLSGELPHARPQALSPVSHSHPGAYALGPVLLVWPGVACDRRRGLARTAHPVAGALDRGRARRAGCSPRHAAGPCPPSAGVRAVGASSGPTLVDCVVSQFSRHDGDGEPRVVLAARHGGPAGGTVGARRAGSAHRLPLRGLAGGWSTLPGSGVWCHSGTAPVSRHHR